MEFQIPIGTIMTQAFGLVAPRFRRFSLSEDQAVEMKQLEDDEDSEITSMLGTPVQFWMAFNGRDNFKKRSMGEIKEVSLSGMDLPYTSVATFTRSKRDTETYMSGQEGDIVEEYGFESWNIHVQGLILKNDKALSKGKSTVDDQVKELLTYEAVSDSIGVKGKMFELLNIHEVRIKTLTFPPLKNWNPKVVMPYEMHLKSVQPIQLIEE
jgi:hypothetical protein